MNDDRDESRPLAAGMRYELLRGLIRSDRRTLQSDRRHLLEEFRLVDTARKIVGVGSVGARAWIILMLGRDDTDPLFLQGARPAMSQATADAYRRSSHERVHGLR